MDTYVSEIEPRRTPHRPVLPETVPDTLIEACRDLEQETLARISTETRYWQPHPDAGPVGVTVWHIADALDDPVDRELLKKEWPFHYPADKVPADDVPDFKRTVDSYVGRAAAQSEETE